LHHAQSAAIAAVFLVSACGSSSTTATSSHTAITVASGSGLGCPADQRQDLNFSGALVGRLACSDGGATCDFVYAGKPTEHAFTAAIRAIAGDKPLLISFAVAQFNGPGKYAIDNVEGGTTISLDGPTHWLGQLGDAITVTSADRQVLTGSLESTLTDGRIGPVHLVGSWVCTRAS